MFTVYILYSLKDKKLYTGCTHDATSRLEAHNSGKVHATKHRRPLIVIYTEGFENKADAFNRERFLKSLWGTREKKKILQRYLAQQKERSLD